MCVCVGGGAINKTAMSYRRNSVWVAHHPHGSFFMQQHMGMRSTSHTPILANWCEALPRSDRSVKAARMKCTVWNNGKKGRDA